MFYVLYNLKLAGQLRWKPATPCVL